MVNYIWFMDERFLLLFEFQKNAQYDTASKHQQVLACPLLYAMHI